MINRKLRLTAEQKQQLNNTEKEVNHTHLLKRIQCIKLKDMGWTNIKICEFLNVCNRTIAEWINDFQEQGLVGLLSWDYEGRASLLN